MGFGKEVQITIADGKVAVRDFGRGIPLGKVVDCVSKINTGAKYNDDVFQFSVGLNGVGTKAVNALSKTFLVARKPSQGGRVRRGQLQDWQIEGEQGGASWRTNRTAPSSSSNRTRRFSEDHRVPAGAGREAAAALQLFEHRPEADLPTARRSNPAAASWTWCWRICRRTTASRFIPRSISPARRWSFGFFTHSNSQLRREFLLLLRQRAMHTADGGTHLSAFREGLLKAVNEYAKGQIRRER